MVRTSPATLPSHPIGMPKKFDKFSQHVERHALNKEAAPIELTQEELGKYNRGEIYEIPNVDETHPSGILLPRDDSRDPGRDWEINLGMTDGDIRDESQASEYREHVTRLVTEFANKQKIPFPVQVLLGLGTWENDMENSIVIRIFDVGRKTVEEFLDFLGSYLIKEEAFAYKPTTADKNEVWPNPYYDPSGGDGLERGRPG